MNHKWPKNAYEQGYKILDTIYEDHEQKTLLAVSWWPDSMYLTHVVQQYRWDKKRNPELLHYIYCDHQVRKHTDPDTITQYIDKEKLFITTRKKTKNYSEAILRKRRYGQIQKYAKKNDIKILLTGHNLSDRIESTFLNMLRGSDIDWFMSMKAREKSSHMFTGTVGRPLLEYNKSYIQEQCDTIQIPYHIDTSNFDTTVSKRNTLRQSVLQTLKELSHKHNKQTNSFEESMQNIYNRYENNHTNHAEKLTTIPRYKHRKSDRAYKRHIKQKDISSQKIKDIAKSLHISNNLTKKNLYEITEFLQNKSSGHKYINQTYRFINHGTISIIKARKRFWEQKCSKKDKNIKNYFIDRENHEEERPENRRFGKGKDTINKKPLKKRCINKKIPIFWRNNIIYKIEKNKEEPYIPKFMLA